MKSLMQRITSAGKRFGPRMALGAVVAVAATFIAIGSDTKQADASCNPYYYGCNYHTPYRVASYTYYPRPVVSSYYYTPYRVASYTSYNRPVVTQTYLNNRLCYVVGSQVYYYNPYNYGGYYAPHHLVYSPNYFSNY